VLACPEPETSLVEGRSPPGPQLVVERLGAVCQGVIALSLAAAPGTTLPAADPGAHIDVHLPIGLVRQYSLISAGPERYEIAIQHDATSRGGSRWLCEHLRAGMRLAVGAPRNHFPLRPASSYRFIAGGIGITPILSMIRKLASDRVPYNLIYCTRSPERTPFREELAAPPHADKVSFVHDGGMPERGLDVARAVASPVEDARLYCCGPSSLMEAVRKSALAAGWKPDRLHFESFKAQPHAGAGNRRFTVVVASSGEELTVPEDRTILDVLRSAGYAVDSACEDGVCGTCQVGVLDGVPDHRDSVLSPAEQEAGKVIQVCCSRAASDRLVLDL
jgi:vanillate O-demethylase ferredoxin subunit